ncbi:MAG: ATP-binding cassette domain-containing protein [Chitinophagaceae bacterium]
MKNILSNTLSILADSERKKFYVFTMLNAIISIADIAFLGLLVLLVGVYTKADFHFHLPPSIPVKLLNPDSIYPALFFLFCFIIKNTLAYIAGFLQYRYIYHVALRIAGNNLLYYLEGDYNEYSGIDSSVHIQKISQQPIEFCHYVLTGILQMFTEYTLIIFTVIGILLYNAPSFLLLLILLLPAVLVLAYFNKRRLKAVRLHIKTTSEKTMQHLYEALGSYVESNIYNKKEFFSKRYIHYQGLLNKYLSDLTIIKGLPSRFIEILAITGFFILVFIHIAFGNSDAVSLVTIGAFTVAVYKIIPGIAKILNISAQIHAYAYTTQNLSKSGLSRSPVLKNTSITERINSVEFKEVVYRYSQDKENSSVKKHINLNLGKGDFLGISGASGKGKTTIFNLLLGFLEPMEGNILINGGKTNEEKRKLYWKDIAYSRQHAFLIHDSILKNITLDEDHVNEERLNTAIYISGLSELLDKYPDGVHHVINENGKNISGGQRKRIVLARTLYKEAGLILLDEPFNELDRNSGTIILKHLQKLTEAGKIVVVITHDKESLSFCNKIISLDELYSQNIDHSYSGISG